LRSLDPVPLLTTLASQDSLSAPVCRLLSQIKSTTET
jgi:hypothetical protein